MEIEKIFGIIKKEQARQNRNIELIASENFVSKDVLKAQGSILTNKYAEGYPNKRYYGGCEYMDEIENMAISALKKLFNVKYANVQPHSGSQANMAVYRSLINYGDKVLGMALDHGGHLTHGHKLSFSGQDYDIYSYGVDKNSGLIDYDEVRKIAHEVKPKMILAGASAYPRVIDFKKFRDIANEVGAYLFVDMAHIAGLVAAGLHQNPCDYAHVVSSTTHKTMRGPRGGFILTNDEELAKKIDKNVFPGVQGGPLMHVIAAKAVAFNEALTESFINYSKQVIKNAKALADRFMELGYKVISNGTDNHLVLIDVFSSIEVKGNEAEKRLGSINITINKNTVPFDPLPPLVTSGIRLGTPAMTTKGFKENDFVEVANIIDAYLRKYISINEGKRRVKGLISKLNSINLNTVK